MNRHIRLFGIAVGLLAGTGVRADVDPALSLSVVQILAYSDTGRIYLGSGVIVAPGRVATNCHVTQRAQAILVAKGGLRFRAGGQRADVERDLCLLDVADVSLPAARLGRTSRLAVGEPLSLYGFPHAAGMAFSRGRVQWLHAFKDSRVIETSTDLAEGVSGGGIFDEAGRLMGLATFFSAGHSGRNYAIPVDWIAGLSRQTPRKIAPVEGTPFWQDFKHLPAFLRAPGQNGPLGSGRRPE